MHSPPNIIKYIKGFPQASSNLIVLHFVSVPPVYHNDSVQHYVIKFVSDLRQVDGFLRVLRFPPPIKLAATLNTIKHMSSFVTLIFRNGLPLSFVTLIFCNGLPSHGGCNQSFRSGDFK